MIKFLNVYFRQHHGFVAGKRLHDSREAAESLLRTVRNDTRPLGVIAVEVSEAIVSLAYPVTEGTLDTNNDDAADAAADAGNDD